MYHKYHNNLLTLQNKSKQLNIKSIENDAFKKYGKIYHFYDFSEPMQFITQIKIPEEGKDIYVKNSKEINKMKIFEKIKNNIF